MKKIKTITICSSASHYRQVLEIEKELKKLGFKVKIPKTANTMKRNNDFDVSHYKTWFKNKNDYHKKTKLMLGHFKKVMESDAILITNFEKNGMKGYIGGNALMEMLVAFLNKKPIYIYNKPSENLSTIEEIYGVKPNIINGYLTKI